MKPVVSALNAWSCTIISLFAIIILSAIATLFKTGNHITNGSEEAPENPQAVAGAIYGAVAVYAAFAVFCGLQGILDIRQRRNARGAIQLA